MCSTNKSNCSSRRQNAKNLWLCLPTFMGIWQQVPTTVPSPESQLHGPLSIPFDPRPAQSTCHQHTLRYLISSFTDLIFFQSYRSTWLSTRSYSSSSSFSSCCCHISLIRLVHWSNLRHSLFCLLSFGYFIAWLVRFGSHRFDICLSSVCCLAAAVTVAVDPGYELSCERLEHLASHQFASRSELDFQI